jgi:predicted nuclease of predicted toxin-antitoxin system
MKVLVDMNLSPRWVAELRSAGVESVHWRDVGPTSATDREVLGHPAQVGARAGHDRRYVANLNPATEK